MGLIRTLPPEVANLIAAGEVVERPASAVRELLDNAVDAGAGRIDVDLVDGGRELVAVADDGRGMAPDDAAMAFERHATSKIATARDLDAIQTLGFRGEALAAIGAVARVELVSRSDGTAGGQRVVVDHGRRVLDEPAGRAIGTTVAVHDLFSGVPARRKFLKSASTELDHCLRAVQRVALAEPRISFRVRHEDRVVLELAPVEAAIDRVSAILGPRWGRGLMEVYEQVGPARLTAWIARAEINRSTAAGVHMLVNGRPVRDALLIRAVADSFRHLVPAGRYPVAVIDLRLPADEVDVNVHPAKTEVRFARPREVRALVVGTLRGAATSSGAVPSITPPGAGEPAGERGSLEPGVVPTLASDRAPANHRLYEEAGAGARADGQVREADAGLFARGVRSLAQYANCFIIAEDAEGMLIVDQHVAHERLLFEQLVRQAESAPLPRQALVFPGTLELGPAGIERFEQHREAFKRLGFGAERFGSGALRVTEIPAVYGRSARAESLEEILEGVESGRSVEPEALFRRLLATVACHSAVRKGMALSLEKMDYILRGLSSCEVPTHCPHGRVVSLRVDLGPLEREFGR